MISLKKKKNELLFPEQVKSLCCMCFHKVIYHPFKAVIIVYILKIIVDYLNKIFFPQWIVLWKQDACTFGFAHRYNLALWLAQSILTLSTIDI